MSERASLMIQLGKLFPGQSICEICINLRMAVNGSADPWDDDKVNKTLALLQGRIDNWSDSTLRSFPVDQAVKNLVQLTIWEVTLELEERKAAR